MNLLESTEKICYHVQDVIRELAKNCRNEKYENVRIVCSDGVLGLNQLMAFLVLPELNALAGEIFGEKVILLPQFLVQDVNIRMRSFFESVTKNLEECIETAQLQSTQILLFQESSTVDQIINEEVLKGVDDADLLLFDESQFSEQNLVMALGETSNSSSSIFKCHQCEQTFTRKTSLERHMNCKHEKKQEPCKDCGKLIRKDNEEAHSRLHKPTSLMCITCGRFFKRKVDLKDHINIHFNPERHKCSICDKGFHSKATLSHHMKTHRPRTFVCEECDKSFVSATKLKRHKISHGENPKIYQCSECTSQFSRVDNLKKHMKKQHNIHIADLRTHKAELVKPVEAPTTSELFKSVEEPTTLECVGEPGQGQVQGHEIRDSDVSKGHGQGHGQGHGNELVDSNAGQSYEPVNSGAPERLEDDSIPNESQDSYDMFKPVEEPTDSDAQSFDTIPEEYMLSV